MGLAHWIKDGLMTIFFFVVGLEIKREIVLGELSSFRRAVFPVLAAVGGCIIPAVIYFVINRGSPGEAGWGIPMATDIAFALGILALLGNRVPTNLKVFLTALAIADDMIAVLVIAIFYTDKVNSSSIVIAIFFLFLFFAAIVFRARRPIFYIIPAIGVWVSMMFSGVHATIAGILIAMLVPVRSRVNPNEFFSYISERLSKLTEMGPFTRGSIALDKKQWKLVEEIHLLIEDTIPPGIYLENHFHSVQAFVILPLFALFSAGVTINDTVLSSFPGPISVGIILGLLLGKPAGILLFSWLTVFSGLAELPERVKWIHVLGVAILAGIGFTISIFISELGFKDNAMVSEAKIGIFIASLIAGIIGFTVLKMTLTDAACDDNR